MESLLGEATTLLIAISCISLIAGVVHSGIGFGFGIVAVTFLPMVIEPKLSHIIVSVCSVPMLIMAGWTFRDGFQKTPLLISLIGGCAAMPFGLYLFESISHDFLIRLTGLGVLFMVLSSGRNENLKPKQKRAPGQHLKCLAAGAISGFLAGAVSIAGPPIAAFAIQQNWKNQQYKAFVTQFLLVIAISKAGLLGLRDHIDTEIAMEISVASLCAMIGVRIGEKLSRNLQAKKLKHLVAAMLVVVAITMLLNGSP